MSLDDFRKHLPKYLFPGDEENLYDALRDFVKLSEKNDLAKPSDRIALDNLFKKVHDKFYTQELNSQKLIFQGDGLNYLPYPLPILYMPDPQDPNTLNVSVKSVPGLILSNTCDIDLNNDRDRPNNIVFAPIMNLKKVLKSFKNSGLNTSEINGFQNSVRRWDHTNVFYLPACKWIGMPESIVFLDKISSFPSSLYDRNQVPEARLFSLSMFGFYLLLFKLSIHFTRFKEHVHRPFIDPTLFSASMYLPNSVE